MELNKTYKVGPRTNIMELMKLFLKNEVVDSVVWFTIKKKEKKPLSLSPVEVTDPDELKDDLLGLYSLFNFSRMDTTANFVRDELNGAKDKKVAVIAKPCDVRAFIELQKVRQVNLNNLLILSLECPETIDTGKLKKLLKKKKIDPVELTNICRPTMNSIMIELGSDEKTIEMEDDLIYINCTRCPRKIDMNADINIGEREKGIWAIHIVSEKGKEAVDKVPTDGIISEPIDTENELINKLIDISQKKRTADFEKLDEMSREERFKLFYDTFSKCRKCGSCIRACPVCFCKDCDVQRKRKEDIKRKKAGIEDWETFDNILYILTKMGHMCDTCIECGKCSQVCPVNIPSANTYRYINDKIQKKYDYVAGRNVDETSPRSGNEIKKLLAVLEK
ncbi:MAG: hypothetical protein GF329_18545 [Candidatus Lokiarchaeota archaeon]|nr:hypothetical protein [Candidatus Lokiarchaeota archaeon]